MASPVLGPAGQPVATATPNASLDLRAHGLLHVGPVYANRSPAELTEIALARGEGLLAYRGARSVHGGADGAFSKRQVCHRGGGEEG